MNTMTHLVCYSFLLGTLAFATHSYSKLSDTKDMLWKDNQTLVTQLETQNKTVYKLMDNGWTEAKARDFVEQGCLMYIEVR